MLPVPFDAQIAARLRSQIHPSNACVPSCPRRGAMNELCVLGAIVVAFGCFALASVMIVSALSRRRPADAQRHRRVGDRRE
jgi:hypothetical protein